MDQSTLAALQENILFIQFSGVIIYLIWGVSLLVIAKKEKEEFPWFGFIPILNLLLIAKLAKKSPWLWLIGLIPCVGWLIFPFMWYHVGQERGNKGIWGLLMVVPCFWFVSPVVIAAGD